MTYQELDQWDSPNYTPAAQCPQVFGEPRNPTTFTIHHWGDPSWGQTFEGVVSYLCDGNRPNPTSAHFVVEAGRSACIVSPDDVAWHAGNAHGNATSIGIECNPLERDGDYQTIGELIAHLRTIYGDLPLVPHNHWIQTDCPGTYDLARIDAIARGTAPAPAPQPAIVPQEDPMFLAKLADDDKVYISNGVWYRYVQDPATLDALVSTLGLAAKPVEVPSLNVLGVAADQIPQSILAFPVPRQGVDPTKYGSPDTSVGAIVGNFDAAVSGLSGEIKAAAPTLTDAQATTIAQQILKGGLAIPSAQDNATATVTAIKGQWGK